jgi:hypothetical protein
MAPSRAIQIGTKVGNVIVIPVAIFGAALIFAIASGGIGHIRKRKFDKALAVVWSQNHDTKKKALPKKPKTNAAAGSADVEETEFQGLLGVVGEAWASGALGDRDSARHSELGSLDTRPQTATSQSGTSNIELHVLERGLMGDDRSPKISRSK